MYELYVSFHKLQRKIVYWKRRKVKWDKNKDMETREGRRTMKEKYMYKRRERTEKERGKKHEKRTWMTRSWDDKNYIPFCLRWKHADVIKVRRKTFLFDRNKRETYFSFQFYRCPSIFFCFKSKRGDREERTIIVEKIIDSKERTRGNGRRESKTENNKHPMRCYQKWV